MSESSAYFEKQRDLLIQEIGISIESLVYNLDILNRSLSGSISVGKEFDNVGRLWSHFYDGVNQLRERKEKEGEEKQQDRDESENLRDTDNDQVKMADHQASEDDQSGDENERNTEHSGEEM